MDKSNQRRTLEKNKTWVLVSKANNVNIISNRWIFKRKYKTDGTICKYKDLS